MKAIKGKITHLENIRTSKKGKVYINFVVQDKNKLVTCQAFEAMAEMLAEKGTTGASVSLFGYLRDDGDVFCANSVLLGASDDAPAEIATNQKRLVPAPYKPQEIDRLMDALGVERVTAALREWLGGCRLENLKNFDVQGYKNLITKLWDEVTF